MSTQGAKQATPARQRLQARRDRKSVASTLAANGVGKSSVLGAMESIPRVSRSFHHGCFMWLFHAVQRT